MIWCKISYQGPTDITQIHNQSLRNNSFIVTQGKPIFNLPFINKGILKVSDLLYNSGNLLSWQLGKSEHNLDNKDLDRINRVNSTKAEKGNKTFFSTFCPCSLRREPFLPD